jgi:hypothetical protein
VALIVSGAPPGIGADDPLHVGEALDLATVDGEHDVAGLEPRSGCRRIRLHCVDPGRGGLAAVKREDEGENHDRQDEIGDRAGDHDGGSTADRLVVEALAALLRVHAFDGGLIGDARRVLVAEKLHIAAQRNGRDLPAGAVTVGEAGEFRSETHRKSEHPHAAPAGDQEVAELMEEDDDAESEQKGDDPAGESPAPQSKIAENVHSGPDPAILRSAPADLLG